MTRLAAASTKRSRISKHGARIGTTTRTLSALAASTPVEEWAPTQFGKDLLRARWDIDFFAERFLGIKGHPGQQRLWRAILARDETGWEPRYLTISCAAGNRAGKTLGISIPMLHSTFFKIGLQPPNPLDERDVRRWMGQSYEWYHFAIAQETAELAYIEITRILSGTHEAQKDGCPLSKALGKGVADWSRKYRGEYLWIKLSPILGGGELHFRTTGEKALGSLGKDMHGVSYDEAGFDPHFDFVVNEVLNLRRLSTGGQMWLIGTSTEGITAFADKWEEGNPEAPDRKRDAWSMRMSTRDNIGFGITQKQFDRLVDTIPPELIPQNIDGFFIEGSKAFFSSRSVDDAFIKDLHGEGVELKNGEKGHRYVQGVDPALTYDSTWSIVLDATTPDLGVGVRATRVTGRTTGPVIAALATDAHLAYQNKGSAIETGIDATGFGGKMFRDLLDIKPLRSIEFGGTSGRKLRLLNDVKAMLERGQLKFPRHGKWLELRRQLLGYRMPDKGLDTDAVMALAVAVSLLKRTPAGALAVIPFDYFHEGEDVVTYPAIGRPPSGSYARTLSDVFKG